MSTPCPHCGSAQVISLVFGPRTLQVRFLPSDQIAEECGEGVWGCADKECEKGHAYIDWTLRGEERLDILIHEIVHFAVPSLSEAMVSRLGTQIAKAIVADGWTRPD